MMYSGQGPLRPLFLGGSLSQPHSICALVLFSSTIIAASIPGKGDLTFPISLGRCLPSRRQQSGWQAPVKMRSSAVTSFSPNPTICQDHLDVIWEYDPQQLLRSQALLPGDGPSLVRFCSCEWQKPADGAGALAPNTLNPTYSLKHRSANLFCTGPNSKYLGLIDHTIFVATIQLCFGSMKVGIENM